MENDLLMAREVQLALLPRQSVTVHAGERSVHLAHRYRPAEGVSGDFFDLLELADQSVGVLICDVMGHGVRSALIAAMVRAFLEELRANMEDPGALLTGMNRKLTQALRQTGGLIFVTAAYAVMHIPSGHLRYAQAGHPPALARRTGEGLAARLPAGPGGSRTRIDRGF